MSKEMITAMSAAQRLGQSVAEVEALWKAGKLTGKKESSTLYLEKESVYAYSGIAEGKQNKKEVKPVDAKTKAAKKSTKNENETKAVAHTPTSKSDDSVHVEAPQESQASQERGGTDAEQTKGSETAEPQEQTSKKGATDEDADDVGKDGDEVGSEDAGVKLDPDMSLDDVMKYLFPGIQYMDKAVRALAVGGRKKCVKKYNTHDMKEVADMAYKMGKLAVYESMDSFQRKRPEKLAKAKAKA